MMNRIARHYAMGIVMLASSLGFSAWASDSPRGLSSGVVFPSLHEGALKNPATLPHTEDFAVSAQGTYSPDLAGSGTQSYSGSVAMSSPKVGLGVNLAGLSFMGGSLAHTLTMGAGYRTSGLGIGVAYSTAFSSYTSIGDLLVGTVFGKASKTNFALVARGLLAGDPQLSAGLGFMDPDEGRYFLEVNLLFPAFSSGFTTVGSAYAASLFAGMKVGRFGLGFGADFDYVTGQSFTLTPSFQVQGTLLITKALGISAKYESGNLVTFGLSWLF